MEIASRTPEGVPNRCPVCGNEVKIEPSTPAGDAPCPHCGTLLWFTSLEDGRLTALAVRIRPSAIGRHSPHSNTAPLHAFSPVEPGDRVRITAGTFAGYEGRVDIVETASGRLTVMISIYGRNTPVELEMFQIERLPD